MGEIHVVYTGCFPGVDFRQETKYEDYCTLYMLETLCRIYGKSNVHALIATHGNLPDEDGYTHDLSEGLLKTVLPAWVSAFELPFPEDCFVFKVNHPFLQICTEERAHNIAFTKEILARSAGILAQKAGGEGRVPLVFFCDSDMIVSRGSVIESVRIPPEGKPFLSLYPYVLRDALNAPVNQAGAYMVSAAAMREPAYITGIYQTRWDGEVMHRGMAPDCFFKTKCARGGDVKVSRVKEAVTLHFRSATEVGVYRRGKLSVETFPDLRDGGCRYMDFRQEVDRKLND
jgi:hypothetical protein